MNNFWKISNLIVLGYLLILVVIGLFFEHISFGLGLGDFIGYIALIGGTILHLILTAYNRNKKNKTHLFLFVIFGLFALITSLKATIWRGSAYGWNGSIFYLPCPNEIKITNNSRSTKKLITMCTGQYLTEFNAVWNGTAFEQITGEIKIPQGLNHHFKSEITVIIPRSEITTNYIDETLVENPRFSTDTLVINKSYKYIGQLCEINNGIPIFKGRILNGR